MMELKAAKFLRDVYSKLQFSRHCVSTRRAPCGFPQDEFYFRVSSLGTAPVCMNAKHLYIANTGKEIDFVGVCLSSRQILWTSQNGFAALVGALLANGKIVNER
jgi:hypothetical protein